MAFQPELAESADRAGSARTSADSVRTLADNVEVDFVRTSTLDCAKWWNDAS